MSCQQIRESISLPPAPSPRANNNSNICLKYCPKGLDHLNTHAETLTDIEVEFTYGVLDNTFPDNMKPLNGMYITGDSLNFMLPSHIVFVASSSFDAVNFAGAVGSTLITDNLELID
ncbi:MAG: PCMD domain-containing protein [Bacteroidetes bacterium]|nr:PCMD domain-containing protein [Bacteroidota bacterium]